MSSLIGLISAPSKTSPVASNCKVTQEGNHIVLTDDTSTRAFVQKQEFSEITNSFHNIINKRVTSNGSMRIISFGSEFSTPTIPQIKEWSIQLINQRFPPNTASSIPISAGLIYDKDVTDFFSLNGGKSEMFEMMETDNIHDAIDLVDYSFEKFRRFKESVYVLHIGEEPFFEWVVVPRVDAFVPQPSIAGLPPNEKLLFIMKQFPSLKENGIDRFRRMSNVFRLVSDTFCDIPTLWVCHIAKDVTLKSNAALFRVVNYVTESSKLNFTVSRSELFFLKSKEVVEYGESERDAMSEITIINDDQRHEAELEEKLLKKELKMKFSDESDSGDNLLDQDKDSDDNEGENEGENDDENETGKDNKFGGKGANSTGKGGKLSPKGKLGSKSDKNSIANQKGQKNKGAKNATGKEGDGIDDQDNQEYDEDLLADKLRDASLEGIEDDDENNKLNKKKLNNKSNLKGKGKGAENGADNGTGREDFYSQDEIEGNVSDSKKSPSKSGAKGKGKQSTGKNAKGATSPGKGGKNSQNGNKNGGINDDNLDEDGTNQISSEKKLMSGKEKERLGENNNDENEYDEYDDENNDQQQEGMVILDASAAVINADDVVQDNDSKELERIRKQHELQQKEEENLAALRTGGKKPRKKRTRNNNSDKDADSKNSNNKDNKDNNQAAVEDTRTPEEIQEEEERNRKIAELREQRRKKRLEKEEKKKMKKKEESAAASAQTGSTMSKRDRITRRMQKLREMRGNESSEYEYEEEEDSKEIENLMVDKRQKRKMTPYEKRQKNFFNLQLLALRAKKLCENPEATQTELLKIDNEMLLYLGDVDEKRKQTEKDILDLRKRFFAKKKQHATNLKDIENIRCLYLDVHNKNVQFHLPKSTLDREKANRRPQRPEYKRAKELLEMEIENIKREIVSIKRRQAAHA